MICLRPLLAYTVGRSFLCATRSSKSCVAVSWIALLVRLPRSIEAKSYLKTKTRASAYNDVAYSLVHFREPEPGILRSSKQSFESPYSPWTITMLQCIVSIIGPLSSSARLYSTPGVSEDTPPGWVSDCQSTHNPPLLVWDNNSTGGNVEGSPVLVSPTD